MQDPLIINKETVEEIIKKSKEVSRKRALHLREYLDGGNNIGLIYNAFQMGTYVQPHKHPSDGTEIWVAQKGTVRAILFNEDISFSH